jgi:hypothetical protein
MSEANFNNDCTSASRSSQYARVVTPRMVHLIWDRRRLYPQDTFWLLRQLSQYIELLWQSVFHYHSRISYRIRPFIFASLCFFGIMRIHHAYPDKFMHCFAGEWQGLDVALDHPWDVEKLQYNFLVISSPLSDKIGDAEDSI